MNGIIIIDKPSDYTSFDVIAVMRKLTGQKKVGHTGTLDPMATGVLPVLLGSATKAQDIIPNHDKEYIAEFRLGIKTDTQDITGKIIYQRDSNITREALESVLEVFSGNIMQVPPMYSAVQKDGQRLYDLARKGIEVEREARPVKIYSLNLLSFDENSQIGKVCVFCSKGTYIRTLCHDIGEKLGCGATLTSLRRTKACGFSLEDSITLDNAREVAKQSNLSNYVIDVDKVFSDYRELVVTQNQSTRFKNGGGLSIERITLPNDYLNEEIFRIYNRDKLFLGLGNINIEKNELSIFKLF